MIRRSVIALAFIALPMAESTAQSVRPPSMARRSPVYAPHGMAATSQPLATEAAISVLERGGNAIDAAVTAAAVLSVVEPMMTGIGGDMFALFWSSKEQRLVALNASGRAGSLMTREALLKRGHTHVVGRSAESITVPGALAGWQALLSKYGTISLAKAVQPAIRYADEGFPVTPVISQDWQGAADVLQRDDGARAAFLVADGASRRSPHAGEWFRNPDYARTLRAIATGGTRAFYDGPLGAKLVTRVHELGGFLTMDDLRKNQPTWVTPIAVDFKGYRVWELPPNNQGIAT